MERDIVIIGGGPGGYTAAIRAAQLGAKVTLVEKDQLGGTCLNRGCIPTKALYKTAEVLNTLKNVGQFGVTVDNFKVDVAQIQQRKAQIVNQLVSGIAQLLKANNVEVVKGKASIKEARTVQIISEQGEISEIAAQDIILAAGSKVVIPPIPGADLPGIWNSDDILNFDSIPESLAIIGGGVIGMEFAAIFNSLGTKVTVIEFMPSILPMVDSDLTKRFTPLMKRRGIEIKASTKVTKIEEADKAYLLNCEDKKGSSSVSAEKVLICVGRSPEFEGLNLEVLGIEYDRKGIKVDENYCSSEANIYAIGDINGKSMLAHAAAHQGVRAAEHIMKNGEGSKQSLQSFIPSCIFVFPEIATVGLTEEQVKESGINYKISKFLFGANGKALTLGEPEGMVKIIAENNLSGSGEQRILGVHIMGPHASDLIHEAALALSTGLSIESIINTIHAHPTLSEAFSEAVAGLKGEAIHIINTRN